MCGVYDCEDRPSVHDYLLRIGVADSSSLITGVRRRPTQPVSIVTLRHGSPQLETAIWHLYLTRRGGRWVPDKRYWSINTNWRKLSEKPEYRTQRCLIPATAWVESQDGKYPVQFDYGAAAFMFCGLYRVYGGEVLGASIITLPPHRLTARFHAKSLPWVADRTVSFAREWLACDGSKPMFSIAPMIWKGRPLQVMPLRRATSTEAIGPRVEL